MICNELNSLSTKENNATQNVWNKRLLLKASVFFWKQKNSKNVFWVFLFFKKQVPPENVLEVFLFGKRAMFKVAFFWWIFKVASFWQIFKVASIWQISKVASFWQIFKVALQSKMQSTFSLLRNINNLSSFLAFPQMQLPQSLLQ